MGREIKLEDVRTFETSGGNTRFVIGDSEGNEYTTFREAIGEQAQRLQGRSVRIEFHEAQRGRFTNVDLDKVEPAQRQQTQSSDVDTDPEEAAWRTAVDAAPWLLGGSEPEEQIPPKKLYDKLKPFKDRVAEDIEQSKTEGV